MEQKWIICIVPLIFLVCAGIVIEMIRGLLAGKRIRKVQKHRQEEQCYFDAVKQREETLKKMQQEMKEYAAVMKAEGASANEESPQENDWLSAWLQQYQLRAEEKGIRFLLEMEVSPERSFARRDAVSIIGNLLDNALEACETVEHPFVHIRLWTNKSCAGKLPMLEVENSKEESRHPLSHDFQTTKQDKRLHGNGIRIVKELCSRYDYTVTFEDKGTSFLVRVRKTGEE